jgi:hypothetical protein
VFRVSHTLPHTGTHDVDTVHILVECRIDVLTTSALAAEFDWSVHYLSTTQLALADLRGKIFRVQISHQPHFFPARSL